MKELTSKNYLIKLASIYSLLIILLICIPSYFYMQSEIQSYKFNQKTLLQEHSLNIQRAIYDFNDSKSNIFKFPKSFSFDAYLFDKNKNLIYSTSKEKINYKNRIFKKYLLSNNRLDAKSLVVVKLLDLKEIYLKITVLTLSIGLFIFISAFLILKQSITPYKKANEYLDAFFNDAMHEIKTPLGIIQLNLELLEEKIENSKELNRSLNGVKSLLLIYEDIEYLMKYKRVTYTKENMNFSTFLEQRVELFESLASSKQISFNISIEENIYFYINRIELQRIIDNNISNAIKYSNEQSKINITLSKKDFITLVIEDFGKGIRDTDKIFDRYHREDNIKGGFGIGLNIVKNICHKNQIKIKVESALKKGTKFTYFLNS